jgi:hypothetical protein
MIFSCSERAKAAIRGGFCASRIEWPSKGLLGKDLTENTGCRGGSAILIDVESGGEAVAVHAPYPKPRVAKSGGDIKAQVTNTELSQNSLRYILFPKSVSFLMKSLQLVCQTVSVMTWIFQTMLSPYSFA